MRRNRAAASLLGNFASLESLGTKYKQRRRGET
jgi:hypothetical protein